MQEKKKVPIGGIVAVICFMVLVFVPQYSQFQLSPLAHLIMPAYDLDQTQFSMLFSAAMIMGIIFSLIAGILCDKFGIKRMVGLAGILSATALIFRIFAPDFPTLFVCMVCAGFAVTFLNANVAKIMGSWFTPDKVGIAVGVATSGATLAMAVAMATSAYFPSLNAIFVFTAVLAVIAAIVWWVFFKEGPLGMGGAGEDEAQVPTPPLSECLKVAGKSRNVWLIGLILAASMAATMCITTYMPQILASRGFDPTSAGSMTAIITYGNLAGAILAPIMRQYLGGFRPICIVLTLISAVLTAVAWMLPEGPAMVIGFFVLGFGLNGFMAIILSLPVLLPEIGPVYAGTAGGLAATVQLMGAVIIPTYILTPLCGDNFFLFYIIAGLICVGATVCVIALPELFEKKAK